MTRKTFLALLAATAFGRALGRPAAGAALAAPATSGLMRTRAAVAAASSFRASLSTAQREAVRFPFPGGHAAVPALFKGGRDGRMTFVGERFGDAIWSNFPASDVPRAGLPLGAMNAGQKAAAFDMLRMFLSPMGYAKVLDIMGGDDVLAARGTDFASGTPAYTLGLFGAPSDAAPWVLQFGAHHLGLSLLIEGERAGAMPILTGAQPAFHETGGQSVRILAIENDKAFAMLEALDEGQRRQAVLGDAAINIQAGPGQDGTIPPAEGLRESAMDARQRNMLMDLIGEWAGIAHDDYAAPRLAEIRDGLDDTLFAWRGPTACEPGRNGAAYFRVQGPALLIEFAPQEVGGDPTLHVHTIYRIPPRDYGRSLPAN